MPSHRFEHYDVLVAGGGPAGSVCAVLLAREGARVLVANGGIRAGRPPEVLGPATLRALRDLDVREAAQCGARRCRGILSVWNTPAPEFYDYELYACDPAQAVDRRVFDEALLAAAQSSGADVVAARLTGADRDAAGWRATLDGSPVHARLLIDASGRAGLSVAALSSARCFSDRLVCLSTQGVLAALDADVLLVEAVRDGWWYAAPCADGTAVAYLSDGDLLPRDPPARSAHLERSWASTVLFRTRLEAPAFAAHRGFDARTSSRGRKSGADWLAVGDAAFAIDPLSGEGTHLALRSAQRAAEASRDFLNGGTCAALDAFGVWCEAAEADQQQKRQQTYASVNSAFAHETFWRRRM